MKKTAFLLLLIPFLSYGQWEQTGTDIDGEAGVDFSGRSVSLNSDGSIIAIGAPGNDGNGNDSGHVRIYKNLSGVWTQMGADINGEAAGDASGQSISLSSDGSIVAIGATLNDGNGTNSGHVRVFKNINDEWIQIGTDINGEAASNFSGYSISLSSDGTIVAIGATLNNDAGNNSGHVRVYRNIAGVWTQIGADINGEAIGDQSGCAVSISSDGSIVAIGAFTNDGNGANSGHVRVYKNISGVWTQIGADIDGEAANYFSGQSISLCSDGSVVAIGAIGANGNSNHSGHVRVFKNIANVWTQVGTNINGEEVNDAFGASVSLSSDGNIVAIGAEGSDKNGQDSGRVTIYKNISNVWTKINQGINGEAAEDFSGSWAVDLNSEGSVVAIGAFHNDGNGGDSGHVRVYHNASLSIIENNFRNNLLLFPNPSFGISKIQMDTIYASVSVSVFDALGKQIESKEYSNCDEIIISAQHYSKGIYIVKIKSDSSTEATLKWVIQ